MSDPSYSLRIRKFRTNPLLCRKQFCVDVIHPNRAGVSKDDLRERLAKQYKVADSKCIILFGFRTGFGGGLSKGFGLIYDNLTSVKKFEQHYRLVREGMAEKNTTRMGRRARKELKNRKKKVRGKDKTKCSASKKK